jgi:UDP-GlcNAc:undecaprenyl-phosphate GlcNAc-1-phosphate transferase
MILLALAGIGTAFFLAVLATAVLKRLAVAWGFVANPTQDRHHRAPTPLLGGVAILLAMLLPSLLVLALAALWARGGVPAWLPEQLRRLLEIHLPGVVYKTPIALGILGGAVGLHVVGLIDDKKRLGPWLKLAAQFAVAAAVVFPCKIRVLELLGEPASSILTLLWIVLITNTFNFLDNVDGLSAGVAAICGAALLGAALVSGQLFVAAWLCLLLGATLGFLVHNFPPGTVFMGDAGSLVLGFMLAVLSILTTYYHPSAAAGAPGLYYAVPAPLVLLAVPLYDTFSVITLRLRDRRNPMVGDTRHFSHRLLRRGMSPRKAVLTIYLATAATAVGASLLPHVDRIGALLVYGQTIAVVLLIALLESAEGNARP